MSGHPIWATVAGNLGVVPEGVFYRVALSAHDPEFPLNDTAITYSLIAGELPAGVQLSTTGIIEGIPVSVGDFKGIPAEVSEDTISKFAVRATDEDDRISDRTFTLTVSGQDMPEFITPAGTLLGSPFTDGTEMSFQFETFDPDPTDVLVIKLIDGTLPIGVTLSASGLLYGFIDPIGTSTPFSFTLEVSDGKDVSLRTFDFTVSGGAAIEPLLLTVTEDLGSFRHENYFTHQFDGFDPEGAVLEYVLVTPGLPIGITLNTETGWLSGVLADHFQTTVTYNFTIRVQRLLQPTLMSRDYDFSITVFGNIEEVHWLTDEYLGTINNGEVSTFSVAAFHPDSELQYRILTGSNSKLPQGLTLLPSGNIAGRTSFKMFSLDGNTTTFDSDFGTRLSNEPTTFDSVFRFIIEAFYVQGMVELVSINKVFEITVLQENDLPNNTLYCNALPPITDREILEPFLADEQIFDSDIIFRSDDSNFGVATRISYQHAFGLNPGTVVDYFNALEFNHYNKNLVLGVLKTAIALDNNGDILYEVVYSEIVDNLVNPTGQSVSSTIEDNITGLELHPNSLENMRTEVINHIGQQSKALPRWMVSKQENGEILGFTPSWVIAYTKPEKSALLKYNIDKTFSDKLNLIDFEVDRYILDSLLSKDWILLTADNILETADSSTIVNAGSWARAAATTFDRDDGIENETIIDGGSCRFIAPVDEYDNTDEFDSYIKFPQTRII